MLRRWRESTVELLARYRRTIGIGCTVAIVVAAVMPAQAQQMMVPTAPPHDRVRISGFLFRAKTTGVLDLESFQGIPGLEDGIGISSTLGLDEASNGFTFEANVAAARRHRLIFVYTGIEHTGERSVTIPLPGPDLIIDAESRLKLREFHGFYNFVFAANSSVEAGLLGGIGYFDVEAALTSNLGNPSGTIDQAFPSFGANLLLGPSSRARGYVEMTGFPSVSVDNLSGYQLDFIARAEVFITREIAGVVGYRNYRINIDDEETGVGVDVRWHGFNFGVMIRY